MKFRNKSIILVGIIIILSFGGVAYLIGEKMAVTAGKMSLDLAVSKAQNSFLIVKNELDGSVLRTGLMANALVESIDFPGQDEKVIVKTLQSELKIRNELNACWYSSIDENDASGPGKLNVYFRKKGNEIVKSPLLEKQLDLIEKLMIQGREMISAPYWSSDNRLLATVLEPVIKNDKIVGVLGTDLDLYHFQQHFYDNESLGRAYVTIISEQGFCISHPDENLIGKRIDTLAEGARIHEVLASGNKYQEEVQSDYLQVPVMRVYQPVKIGNLDKKWLVTVSVPLFNVKESVQEIRNSTFLIGLVLALLLMIFLYFSQRRWFLEFSKRQRAERKHRNEVSKLSSIMESTDQIMIFSVDKNYRYTSFNSVHKLNLEKNEGGNIRLGSNSLDTYYGDFRIQMKKHLDRALAGDHFLVEFKRHGIDYQQIFNAISDAEGKVVGVSSFCFDISETLELRRKALEEEEEKVKAQLKNIKNQINPHFLFNSLNSLYALVEGEPKLARKFILSLSKVYRYLLDSNNSNLISLKQELDFIKQYLFLQKIRFGDNLLLEYDIKDEALNRKLPSVSIQSLVENAIKHNIITSEKPLTIRISVSDEYYLIVENPYQPRTDMSHSPGTGLKTLEALYAFLGDKQPVYGIENGFFRVKLPLF
ncbi:histidine kinase [Labilibaculum euxinus]